MCLPTFPRICRQKFSCAKVTPVYTQFLDSRAKLSFQITWRVLPPQWRNNFSNNWILHWDCYNKNVKWIISRQRAKSFQHHNKRGLKPIRGLPGLCLVSTVAILKPSEKTWEEHKTSAREVMPRLRGFMGYWYLYLWDSSEGVFSLLVFLPRGWNSGPQSRSRSNRDSGPLNNEPADHSLTPPPSQPPSPLNLCQEGFLAIYKKTKKFLEKKIQWPSKYTKCRVSDFLTRYYSTDRGIIETTLKTSFPSSHFSLFLPIPIDQISAFSRTEKRVRTVQERKRDDGVTNRRYKPRSPDWWSLLQGMWGFSRFSFESFWQFFLSLRNDSSPFLCQQVLNSRFGDQVHENFATISKFGRQYESTASQKWLGMIYFVRFFKNLKICT